MKAELGSALQDGRNAEAFFSAAKVKFVDDRPFLNIFKAERQHQAIPISLSDTCGVAVSENSYATGARDAPVTPVTLTGACKVGVESEIVNRDIYDGNLFPAAIAYFNFARVSQRLRDASEKNHLLAFQHCANHS